MSKEQMWVAKAILQALAKSGESGTIDYGLYWRCQRMAKNLARELEKGQ